MGYIDNVYFDTKTKLDKIEGDSNRLSPGDRYHKDPQFAQLVDLFYMFICKAQYTPTEIREAAILAAVKYDMSNVRSFVWSRLTDKVGPSEKDRGT